MKILTISYKQKFPTGSFLNCDIGFEASIEPGEDINDALSTLQNHAQAFHKSSFPHLYTENGKPITIVQVEEDKPELTQEEALILLIEKDCKTIQLLERQRKQIERMNSQRVNEAFESKLKKLSGNQ